MASNEQVVVVGAGPVGLVAALALAKQGVRVTVLEAEPEDRTRPGSRAIVLFQPTPKRLDEVEPGLGKAIAETAVQLESGEAWYDGRRVFKARFPRLAPLRAPAVVIPQPRVEEFVYKAALDHGVEFRWSTSVAGVTSSPDGVAMRLASGEELHAAYVIAADGARSVVREQLGLRLEGPRDNTPFIIVDVDEDPDRVDELPSAFFAYNCEAVGGRNVMHMGFGSGRRIDLQCFPDDDVEYLCSPEGIREWVAPILGEWSAERVQWVSTYVFHQAVANSYTDQHHRVLLAGEAAHLFAPWGGRGLNSGIIDATDAADAIGKAMRDPERAEAHIQRCAEDRRKWGLHNRDLSSRALHQMRAEEPWIRFIRDLAARVSPAFLPAGAWLAAIPAKPFIPWPWAKSYY